MYALREGSTPARPLQPVADDWIDPGTRTQTRPGTLRTTWPRLVREAAEVRWGGEPDAPAPLAPAPSPDSDDDEIFLLGERCAEAYMQADALHYRAMQLLAEFHRRDGWRDTGFPSTAEWLAWRIGIRLNAARERLRTALALEELPATSQAMANGELSFTKVRSLTRVATPENEATLLDFARAGSAANLERVVRGWKTLDRKSEVTAEQVRYRSRRFSAWVDDDGMVVVRGRLDPEAGAVLMRAVEAAGDALYRRGAEGAEGCDAEAGCQGRTEDEARAGLEETTPEQRRADAVGLLAERALAAGFGAASGGEGRGPDAGLAHDHEVDGKADDAHDDASQAEHDAPAETVNQGQVRYRGNVGAEVPISGTRAERYQVMLHVDAGTLSGGEAPSDAPTLSGVPTLSPGGEGGAPGEPGMSELDDGTRVSAETSRRVACDAGLVTIPRGPDGRVLGAGRRTRTVSPALRRALEARDRGCRFPGCGLRFTDAHHVKHWADGGETSLRNLVLLCRRHHRAVHEGGVQVCLDRDGQVVFFTPKGQPLFGAPPVSPVRRAPPLRPTPPPQTLQPPPASPAGTAPRPPRPPPAEADRRPAGAPLYTRDHHIPWALEARAWEALDSG